MNSISKLRSIFDRYHQQTKLQQALPITRITKEKYGIWSKATMNMVLQETNIRFKCTVNYPLKVRKQLKTSLKH